MTATSKRILLWLIILIVVVLGFIAVFRTQPIPVDLVTIEPQNMVVTMSEEGKTRVHDMYVLSAPVSGHLQRISIHAGDPVIAGETVLARIEPGDPSLLDPRSEAEARAAVQTAQSALSLAEAEVDQATAEYEFAQSEWRRANELVAKGTISRRDFDNAARTLKSSRAVLATARAALQMRLFELDQAEARLLSPLDTQRPHEECECIPITAPVSGQVFNIFNASERVVTAGESLLEIGDPAELEVTVDFLSSDAVQIRSGQAVVIDGWGGGQPLRGVVRLVEPFGFTKISALGIEEQRVNVIIDFMGNEADRSLLGHGYQVEAKVILWESDAALTVPLTALFRVGPDWTVFVNNNGRAERRTLQLGHRNGVMAEVKDGLSPGEEVISHLSDRLTAGARIEQRPDR